RRFSRGVPGIPEDPAGARDAGAGLGEPARRHDLPRARRARARGEERHLPRPARRALLRRARVDLQRARVRAQFRKEAGCAPACAIGHAPRHAARVDSAAMNKIKYAVSTLVAAVLFGCAASGYKVSDKGEKYKSSLTREQALKDLHKYVFKSDAQAGVCGAHTNTQFQPATPTAV